MLITAIGCVGKFSAIVASLFKLMFKWMSKFMFKFMFKS